ncbi:uncharacterized protein LOC62_03G005162 [Vanrija pseudolonga]|uniref:F-box domain-containing protein n=1 Tax=Vanrija pseudolonga TaxID=143232 RepID=A0AAF0YD27_9TREE|nr:hypothetical protein LOC62_03G005162 [Vanrija pseudolonga]
MAEEDESSKRIVSDVRTAADLGPDVLLVIGGLLDPEALVSANQVCRAWRTTLSTSSIPWREACTRAHIDEWASGLGPRERGNVVPWTPLTLVLRHVRTERAWALGEARISSRVLDFTVERWDQLHIDARTGLALMRPAPDDEGIDDNALVDTRTWTAAHIIPAGQYSGDDAIYDGVFVRRNQVGVTASNIERSPWSVELVQVCTVPKATDTAVMAFGTGHRAAAGIVELITIEGRVSLRVRAPPDWTPHMVETDTDFISGDDLIPAFTETMLALVQSDGTALWPRRGADVGGRAPVFPFWSTRGVGLAYRVKVASSQSAGLGRAAFTHAKPLLASDSAFDGVVDVETSELEPIVELPPPCFSGTDMLQVAQGLRGDTLLVVRDYASAFDDVVRSGSVRTDQQAELRGRVIALRFDGMIYAIKAYGPRFAIAVGTDVVVLDWRRLPAMPAAGGTLPPPDLCLLVLSGAFPSQNDDSMRLSYHKLAIDERAVYVFNAASRSMTVHAFGE